jgi:uncharacterized membrane protein
MSIQTLTNGTAPDIPAENMAKMLKANLATRLLYVVSICLVKFSILMFYRRLDPRQITRWAIYVLMAWVAALSIVTFFILLFVCTPPSLFWDPRVRPSTQRNA